MAVDKGAIDDGHVLVLPIEHFPNSLGVPPGTHAEMERYLSALQSCYAAQVGFQTFVLSHQRAVSQWPGYQERERLSVRAAVLLCRSGGFLLGTLHDAV